MLISSFNNIHVAGITAAAPTRCVPVDSYIPDFGEETVAKFSKMTGVKSVYRSIPEQTASDMGFEAAVHLFQRLNMDPASIGILVFVTQKPDYRAPSSAFVLHKRLGMKLDCSAYDVNMGCSGYVYGLQIACSLLSASDASAALLITADTSTRTLSPLDRSGIMLFGDCGTATLLEKSSEAAPISIVSRTDGNGFKAIITPAGAYRNLDASRERVLWGDGNIRSDYDSVMHGTDVFNFTISDVPSLMKEFMEYLHTDPDVYDIFAFHQANTFILKQLARKLKIPMEKIHNTMDRFGNTSSNSVPLVLVDAYGESAEPDLHVFMSGFGVGLSWACADVFLDSRLIFPVIHTDAFFAEGVVGRA